MTSSVRRIVAGGLAATALTALTGLGSPAQAASAYWVESYADHTDIVVDWFAVDEVAANLAIISPACEELSALPTAGVFEYAGCMDWVFICAKTADASYKNHAIRVGFSSTGRTCSVIGVG